MGIGFVLSHITSTFLLFKIVSYFLTYSMYRVFQKELYNFESVQKFIQRTYTTF